MRTFLLKLAPWILLCLSIPVAMLAMGKSDEVADLGMALLFIALVWACFVSGPVSLILMAVTLMFVRIFMQYTHGIKTGTHPDTLQLLLAGLTRGIIFLTLAIGFLVYRFRQKRLQLRLLEKARLESMGQLAGGLAHDINNAHSIILGTAQLMRNDQALTEPLRQDLNTIIDATRRAMSMAQRFMGPHQNGLPALQPMNLNTVVDNAYRHVKPAVGPDVELEIQLAAQSLIVRVNDMQINQILINLCINAAEAMDGHGPILIRTESRQVDAAFAAAHNAAEGNYAVLSVIDHGVGMSSKTLSHIFEPFFTTKPPDRGAGLGLVVVRDILRQHGGFVTVESELGKGSTFSVFLPLIQPGKTAESFQGGLP